MSLTQQVFAESYKVVVMPDNVVTESVSVDSFIYDATAEFFADEVVTILNETDFITAPTVSETRANIKEAPSTMLCAKELTKRFKNSYNIDFVALKKLAQKNNSRHILLITSHIDAENYVLRRTFWDFFNVPGASVIDPAYKISTYAVLVDTENNNKLWADTFYKTISVVENRIITRGYSPQTEQLQKIKDYSRLICPQIAQNVQAKILPPEVYEQETKQIDYSIGNIDNVFTKKYRQYGEGLSNSYSKKKTSLSETVRQKKKSILREN